MLLMTPKFLINILIVSRIIGQIVVRRCSTNSMFLSSLAGKQCNVIYPLTWILHRERAEFSPLMALLIVCLTGLFTWIHNDYYRKWHGLWHWHKHWRYFHCNKSKKKRSGRITSNWLASTYYFSFYAFLLWEVCNILVAWGAEFFFLKVCGECQTLLKISKLIFHHGVVDTLRLVTILEGNPVISFNFDFLL